MVYRNDDAKGVNGYCLWNLLNDNLTTGLTDKMQNSDAKYYLQVAALKFKVWDYRMTDRCLFSKLENITTIVQSHTGANLEKLR